MCIFWLLPFKRLIVLGNKIDLIDFFIQTKEKKWENSKLGIDVNLSTSSVVIVTVQGSAETGTTNVILAIRQDLSIQGGQLTGILHFGELYDSAKAFGDIWKRGKCTHNLQRQGRLWPGSVISQSDITSGWNSVRAWTDI